VQPNPVLIRNLNRSLINKICACQDFRSFCRSTGLAVGLVFTSIISISLPGLALPPAEDVPEEVLRTEIITEARSPIDGEWLTAAEYAELEAELQRNPELYNSISPQIREIIFLLQVRRAIRTIAPFLLP